MDSKQLIDDVAKSLGRSQGDVKKLMDALQTVMTERLSELDSISIPGFGVFETKKRNERVVNNPSNGKRMLVPPKIVMSFRLSNVLKNRLNK